MGRQLSDVLPEPRPVAFPIAGGQIVTGIEWRTSDAAVLFLHDTEEELGLDSWGAWPDRFAELGFAVLAVDFPPERAREAASASLQYLAARGAPRRFIVAAGDALKLLDETSGDALVLIAPRTVDGNPLELGITPKLILAGSLEPDKYQLVETYARACRGWSLLSTFATENTPAALLNGRHARQIESQISSFLQEIRTPTPSPPAPRAAKPKPL
jgi:hypothetical protein